MGSLSAQYWRALGASSLLALSLLITPGFAPAMEAAADTPLERSYRRLLPLEGGSNFRDLGDYPTAQGGTVKRGVLFRSGAMTGLTATDQAYLGRFGFQSIVDLRSSEERELYPNPWAAQSDVPYLFHDYSIIAMMRGAAGDRDGAEIGADYSPMYRTMLDTLQPQLKIFFDRLLGEAVPLVVNCSAGQDRTGVTSALLLSVLGVPRDMILEDYLLSTDFRDPRKENGEVDLEAAAKTNAFAAMMLRYKAAGATARPNPLVTAGGTPFLQATFEEIDRRYGSVGAYLEEALGLTAAEQERLRALYTEG